jgi:hypothetical protein
MLILAFYSIKSKCKYKSFVQVIKNLFIKNSPRRLKSESINDKKIPIKRNMSDILIEIVEITRTEATRIKTSNTRGEKLLEIKDIEKIKHNNNEIDLFSLQGILKKEEESFDSDHEDIDDD